MENLPVIDGNPYQLENIVINKLKQMDTLLKSYKDGAELIELARDIALILHLFKLNKRDIKLDAQFIEQLSKKSPDINKPSHKAKANQEQLKNFFHNLQHINDITNFNCRSMLRMKCVSSGNGNKMEFRSKNIGLENVGATCYMNATLQALGQIPELQDFFLYGPPKQEYDNRFSNLITHWLRYYANFYQKFNDYAKGKFDITMFDENNQVHTKTFCDFCIERLKQIAKYKGRWSELDNTVMEELKLILKCFPDDQEFYKELVNQFKGDQGCVSDLPEAAIDIGYEFFVLLKNIRELEENSKGNSYYKPRRFKDFLSIVNSLFKGIQANDSKDLILFLYETCIVFTTDLNQN